MFVNLGGARVVLMTNFNLDKYIIKIVIIPHKGTALLIGKCHTVKNRNFTMEFKPHLTNITKTQSFVCSNGQNK